MVAVIGVIAVHAFTGDYDLALGRGVHEVAVGKTTWDIARHYVCCRYGENKRTR